MELVPIMAKPEVRSFYSSNISGLNAESEAELTVKLDIPAATFEKVKDFMVVMFKVKTA
jgi:hypothetical protein